MSALPEPGFVTVFGLGAIRFLSDLVACAVVGSLITVTTFMSHESDRLSRGARVIVLFSSALCLVWTVLSALQIAFTYSDIVPQPLSQSFNFNQLNSFIGTVPQAKALWIQCCSAAVLGAITLRVRRTLTAQIALALAALAVLPPALTGHASEATNHELAVTSLGLHVIGATVWTGGVIALCVIAYRTSLAIAIDTAAERFSRLALICYIAVISSGVINALVRVDSLRSLFTTQYGILILSKTACAILLGFIGLRHRQATLPRLATNAAIFRKYITFEVAIMFATFAIAVVLTRSAPPA